MLPILLYRARARDLIPEALANPEHMAPDNSERQVRQLYCNPHTQHNTLHNQHMFMASSPLHTHNTTQLHNQHTFMANSSVQSVQFSAFSVEAVNLYHELSIVWVAVNEVSTHIQRLE